MSQRNEYSLELREFSHCIPSTASRLTSRAVQASDSTAIAELMIEAYRGTIDYEGEALRDAVCEVEAYLAGDRGGQALLSDSRLAFAGPLLVGACLAAGEFEGQLALISYTMVRADWKNRGVGKVVVCAVLNALRENGYRGVRAVITEGNMPSERLFDSIGFQKVSNT